MVVLNALLGHFLLFTLILARVGGLIATAPVIGMPEIPMRIRAFFALAISLLVTPLVATGDVAGPVTTLDYLTYLGTEVLVGVVLGLGVQLIFTGLQLTGQIVSQLGGLQLAEMAHAGEPNVPIFSHLLYIVATAVFVLMGGHRQVLDALLQTFQQLPAGQAFVPQGIVETMTSLVTQSFMLGIRAAAPSMAALLLATLLLAIVSRTLPQLNVMALGFGLNAFICLALLAMSLSAAAYLYENQTTLAIDQLTRLFQPQAMSEGAR